MNLGHESGAADHATEIVTKISVAITTSSIRFVSMS